MSYYSEQMRAYDYTHINSQYFFASVMGLGYNKNVLYPRPITLAKMIFTVL